MLLAVLYDFVLLLLLFIMTVAVYAVQFAGYSGWEEGFLGAAGKCFGQWGTTAKELQVHRWLRGPGK